MSNRTATRLIAGCCAAVGVWIGLVSNAQAFVYWGAPGASAIERASLDGTGVNASFITGVTNSYGLAVDSSHIYWADIGNGNIGRANLDGTGVDQTFVTGATEPLAVAVDGTYVYWANKGAHSIGRAPLSDPNGAGKNQAFVNTGASSSPSGVAVNATHVYWSEGNAGTIGRAALSDPGSPTLSLITGVNVTAGVALDDTYVYWTDSSTRIGRAPLDGTSPQHSFISGLTQIPNGLAIDAGHLYWTSTDSFDASMGRIGRADLNGMNVNEGFIGPGSRPDGVAVDAGALPPPAQGPTPTATGPTGRRAAAMRKCRKKHPPGPRRKRCLKRAKKLPV